MLEELSRASRADRYERWGHLLMASAPAVPPGADAVTLPDLFEPEAPGEPVSVTIPLDPALTAFENAGRYYDRARRTRQARAHAEARVLEASERAEEARALLERLRRVDTYEALQAFKREEAARLARLPGEARGRQEASPFRRFVLGGGYELWVGKSARQNDELTFRHARKDDLWMHARGVAGSHAVLRLPHRTARPGRPLLEQAASIAAYFSKAQGSSLVPVIVTPRKYVRKPRGAPPGAVVVEREEVLLVAPRLPG
jgi:predicted ribosome quality control (RQC) complex YloA/Tae2 family protein